MSKEDSIIPPERLIPRPISQRHYRHLNTKTLLSVVATNPPLPDILAAYENQGIPLDPKQELELYEQANQGAMACTIAYAVLRTRKDW